MSPRTVRHSTKEDTLPSPNPDRLAQQVFDFMNCADNREVAAFIDRMAINHRTIQQVFTGMCFSWIIDLAHRESFDLRNEESVTWAKKILESHPDLPNRLPLI
jgi:hypothetical protein